MESNSGLLERILKGQFKNCPKASVQKLLSSQNYVLDTPFLQFLQNTNNVLKVETIELFVDCGADINKSNIRGENAELSSEARGSSVLKKRIMPKTFYF